jgi:hypothetical protein
MRLCAICKSADTCLFNYHLFTFTARLIVFVPYMYALVLFVGHRIAVVVTFWGYICTQFEILGQSSDLPVRSQEGLQCTNAHSRPLWMLALWSRLCRCLCKLTYLRHLTAANKSVTLKRPLRSIAHHQIQAVFTSFVRFRLVRCYENFRSHDFLCSLLDLKTTL